MGLSARACNEILDGAKRLPPSLCDFETAARCGGAFAIFFSYGSLKGVEPGISLLVVLMSLKILEAHTAREFQVMVLMGWVLCLVWIFSFAGFRDRALSPDRIRIAARGADPVSSRIVTRRVLALRWGRHANSSFKPRHSSSFVSFVSPNQYRLTV